ncbi:hypothetical protein EC950943_1497B, partial [Escherichia coli 95.0943]
RYMHYHRW